MSKTKKTETAAFSVNSILDAKVPIAGKHVFSNQGVVQIPADSKETMTVLTAINMYRDIEKQVETLNKVLNDWQAIATTPELYVD